MYGYNSVEGRKEKISIKERLKDLISKTDTM